jgi:hypothetical protein
MNLKNLILAVSCSPGVLGGITTAIARDNSTNLWELRRHTGEGGEITVTVVMRDIQHPPLDYNPNGSDGTDDHGYEFDTNAPAKLLFDSGQGPTNGMTFTAGYYRGPIYCIRGPNMPITNTEADGTNFVSIFSNAKRSELIAAVDHGPIYTSTNFGITWNAITAPGVHKFPLSIDRGANGRGLYAQATIIHTSAPAANWYAIAASGEGSKLVVTASSSEPAPTLNIRNLSVGVTIVWPAEFTGYVLEHTTNLAGGTWTIVTNSVQVVEGENKVIVPRSMDSDFFQLSHP